MLVQLDEIKIRVFRRCFCVVTVAIELSKEDIRTRVQVAMGPQANRIETFVMAKT